MASNTIHPEVTIPVTSKRRGLKLTATLWTIIAPIIGLSVLAGALTTAVIVTRYSATLSSNIDGTTTNLNQPPITISTATSSTPPTTFPSPRCQSLLFAPPVSFAAGQWPDSIVLGDFNSDNHTDLVVGSSYDNTIRLFVGHGNGTFETYISIVTEYGLTFLVVDDLNNDNRLDLACLLSNNVGVLLGRGDGTFDPLMTFPAGTFPFAIAVADFNNDNYPDLIVSNRLDNNIGLLLGYGNGSFGTQTIFSTGSSPTMLAVADFNSDHRLDIAVTNSDSSSARNSVSIFFGYSNGTFRRQKFLSTQDRPWWISAADFNGDNHMDLVITNYQYNTLSLLLGFGNGSFRAEKVLSNDFFPGSIVVGDLNGDTTTDIIVAYDNSGYLNVLLGDGSGSFGAPIEVNTTFPLSMALGDLNEDNRLDAVLANSGDETVNILLNSC